jgi:hypothetical protein
MKGSVFIVAISYAWALALLRGRDDTAWTLAFVFSQILLTGIAGLLILLRLIKLFKKKRSRIYYLTGMFQVSLVITDVLLLIMNKNITRTSLLIFFVVNGLSGTRILTDIYKKPSKG